MGDMLQKGSTLTFLGDGAVGSQGVRKCAIRGSTRGERAVKGKRMTWYTPREGCGCGRRRQLGMFGRKGGT